MRIYYHTSAYISHRLAGLEYIDCLKKLGYTVLREPDRPEDADIAILHDDPLVFPELFSRHPKLADMRSIGFCVWENAVLTPFYIEPLQLVREVWTPSEFSRQSLSLHHAHVSVLPHVVKRIPPDRDDLARARALMRLDEKAGPDAPFVFLSITDSINPRKNVQGLIAAFHSAKRMTSAPIRLVVKQYRLPLDLAGVEGVVSIDEDLSAGEMAALHVLSDAYVSAHHCEGWGLGLSEAMAFGKPVIATGYSGNMEFMNESNSVPVPYRLAPVSADMLERIPLFTKNMQWAEPDSAFFAAAMKRAAEGRLPAGLPQNAAAITRDFGPKSIAARMQALLHPHQQA